MSRSVGQNSYRRHRRTELRHREIEQMARIMATSTQPLRRGFFGRLMWLVFGR